MCCNIVSRVRVTCDNDSLFAVSRYPQGLPPERQRSMIDLRVMEEVKKNQRRSMAVGPFEDLPPHLRNHLVSNIFLGFITPPSFEISSFVGLPAIFYAEFKMQFPYH